MRLLRKTSWGVAGVLWMGAWIGAAGAWGQTQTQQRAEAASKAQVVVVQVKDQSAAEIPGAQVRVAPVPENGPEKMLTDALGELKLQLKPGRYAVYVQAQGFRSEHRRIDVQGSGEAQALPIVLTVGHGGGPVVMEAEPEKSSLTLNVYPFQENLTIPPGELKALPRKTVTVHNGHTNADEKYEGVLLADLLTKYGAPLGKELHGVSLAYYVVATGADGYHAVFSLAEVDPSFHPGDVLVADTMDGKPLDAHSGPFKLVVTEDKRPARGVRNLVMLELKTAE